jgi:DNA-binding LytR/AlgR family response regulator
MLNKKMVCLAVDDEPLALSILKKYIGSVESLELVGTCENAVQALQLLQKYPVDLIFLDIQMPQIMGTDFIRTLKKAPKIIFTTAFRKYAIEGFELDAVDYLLKPISFERFLKAINKVLQTNFNAPDPVNHLNDTISESSPSCLYFRVDRKMVKVLLNDILYIEGFSDYIKIITGTKTIITKHLISSLEETLPKDLFIRIHRSFIVSINKIESYNADIIYMGNKSLPIGRLFKQNVNRLLRTNSNSASNSIRETKK